MSVARAFQNSNQPVTNRRGARLSLSLQTILFFSVIMVSFALLVVFAVESLLEARLAQNCRTDFEYFPRAISTGLESTLDGFHRELSLAASAPERYSGNSGADARRTAVNEAMSANPD